MACQETIRATESLERREFEKGFISDVRYILVLLQSVHLMRGIYARVCNPSGQKEKATSCFCPSKSKTLLFPTIEENFICNHHKKACHRLLLLRETSTIIAEFTNSSAVLSYCFSKVSMLLFPFFSADFSNLSLMQCLPGADLVC